MKPRAVVTGAGVRIGRAIALELAASGFDVCVHAHRSVDAARAVVDACKQRGSDAWIAAGDLSNPAGCAAFVAAVRARWDAVHALVNSAAVFDPVPFEQISLEQWEKVHAVNLRAPFLLSQGLLPCLRAASAADLGGPADQGGVVVQMCDIGADRPVSGYAHYSVSKAGMVMLVKAMAVELAPRVRTVGISPGQVAWPEHYDDERRARLQRRIPMHRAGQPEDVARLARFLVVEGHYLNGVIVPVDGGLSCRYLEVGMTDWITLEAFDLSCIVGVLASEQREAQPLSIGLRLGLPLGAAGDADALNRTVDYAAVVDQVAFVVIEGRFRLLETMGIAIARLLLAPPSPQERRAAVDRVEITLRKPAILGGRAVPGIELARSADELALRTVVGAPGVLADVLVDTPRTAAWRVHLDRQASWTPPAGVAIRTLAGDVDLGGSAYERTPVRAAVRNLGDTTACLLAVHARTGV